MDPQDQTPISGRDDNDEIPKTPEVKGESYSTVGTGSSITSPQGRFQRPTSVASGRRSSNNTLSARSASPGWSGSQNDARDSGSIAERLQRSRSPGSSVGRIDEHEEMGAEGSTQSRLTSPRIHVNDGEDSLGQERENAEQSSKKDKKRSKMEKLHAENDKLRSDMEGLEASIKLTEERYMENCGEVKELREAANTSEMRNRQELEVLRNEKAKIEGELAESQTWVSELEEERSEVPAREELQAKLDKVESQAGDYYGIIEERNAELISLREEFEKHKSSTEPLEKSLKASEQERKHMAEEMKRVSLFMKKIQAETAKTDEERLRECDKQFLTEMDRRDKRIRDGKKQALTAKALQEHMGDMELSRPESVASYPDAPYENLGRTMSSRSGSLQSYSGAAYENLGDVLSSHQGSLQSFPGSPSHGYSQVTQRSRPNSMASRTTDPFTSHSPPFQRSLPTIRAAGLDNEDAPRHLSKEALAKSIQSKSLRFELESRNPKPRKRRGSESSLRPVSKPSKLREMVLMSPENDVPSTAIDEALSRPALDVDESRLDSRVHRRAMSDSVTKKQRLDILKDLQSSSWWSFAWDNDKKGAVYYEEQPEQSLRSQASSSDDDGWSSGAGRMEDPQSDHSVVGQRMRRDSIRRPAPIMTNIVGSPSRSGRRANSISPLSNVAGDVASIVSPSTPRLPDTTEVTSATSRTIEVPPSPGLKRRRAGAPSTTALGSPVAKNFQDNNMDLSESSGHTNSTVLKSPGWQRMETSLPANDTISTQIDFAVTGDAVAPSPTLVEGIVYRRLGDSTSGLATGTGEESAEDTSPIPRMTGANGPDSRPTTKDSETAPLLRPRKYLYQPESPKGWKTGEFTGREAETAGTDGLEANEGTSSAKSANSFRTEADRHSRARATLSTLVQFALIAAGIALVFTAMLDSYIKFSAFKTTSPAWIPTTNTVTVPVWKTSTSTMTMVSMSTATTTEVQTVVEADVETRFLQLAATTVTMTETTTSTSTETETETARPTPRSYTTLTGPQLDSRAAKAKGRVVPLEGARSRAYLGKTYWGWVPEVQKAIDIVMFDVMELGRGSGWGERTY